MTSNARNPLDVKTISHYPRDMLSHEEVIQAFGGSRQLAEAIGVEPKLAIHWPKRGIPAKHWAKVEITPLAKQKGLTALMLGELPIRRIGSAEAA